MTAVPSHLHHHQLLLLQYINYLLQIFFFVYRLINLRYGTASSTLVGHLTNDKVKISVGSPDFWWTLLILHLSSFARIALEPCYSALVGSYAHHWLSLVPGSTVSDMRLCNASTLSFASSRNPNQNVCLVATNTKVLALVLTSEKIPPPPRQVRDSQAQHPVVVGNDKPDKM